MNETLQVLAGFAALGLSIRLGWSIGTALIDAARDFRNERGGRG